MDIILIPGFWLDGSSWDEVVPALERAGHRTHALTLPGMESRDADRSGITLRDHVDAVASVIDSLEPDGRQGRARRALRRWDDRARRGRRAPQPGGPHDLRRQRARRGRRRHQRRASGATAARCRCRTGPLFEDADLVDLDDELRAAFRARAIPTPVHVARDPLHLTDERRYDVPVTIIAVRVPQRAAPEVDRGGTSARPRELAKIRDVGYVDLPTGHWPQFTRPDDLGRAILASVGPPDRARGGPAQPVRPAARMRR